MKIDKALQVARRLLEETELEKVMLSTLKGKPLLVRIELGDYIPEKTFIKVRNIQAEEDVRTMACYSDTGVILE